MSFDSYMRLRCSSLGIGSFGKGAGSCNGLCNILLIGYDAAIYLRLAPIIVRFAECSLLLGGDRIKCYPAINSLVVEPLVSSFYSYRIVRRGCCDYRLIQEKGSW